MHNYSCYLEESGEIPGSFAISWEQRKMGDTSEKVCVGFVGTCEKYYTDETGIPMYRTGNLNGLSLNKDDMKYVTRDFHQQNKKSQLKFGDILIARHGDSGKAVNYESSEEANCLNIVIIRPDFKKCNYRFLTDCINSPRCQKHIKSLSAGSTQAVINTSEIEKLEVLLPESIDEQEKIAAYFENLDHLITLHQRKQCILYIMKKILCGKSKQLEKSISWEQRKLGDVSESFSGGTPSVGNKRYYDGSIPFIRSAEINSESTELFLTEEGLTNSSARMVSKGDILYALYGATSGEVGRSRINGAINQAILAILPHDGYDSKFLMQWLRKSKQSITDVYLQGGQGNLSGAIVKALEVDFPSVIEQRQIGNYFQSFDNLITLHQRKP